tara:strand:+ start:7110 stop:7568 length:459 start_codon:yes stop_codon:yes gene_type:complete
MDFSLKLPSSYTDWREYFLFRYKILRKPINLDRNTTRDNLEKTSFHIMAMNKKNKIIGAGRLHFINSNESQIRYMAVDNKFRKIGIGREIVNKLEEYSIANNRNIIILNSRESAVNFYLRLGYKNLGKIDVGINIKHFHMKKIFKNYLSKTL